MQPSMDTESESDSGTFAARREHLYDGMPSTHTASREVPPGHRVRRPRGDDPTLAMVGHLIPMVGALILLMRLNDREKMSAFLEFQLKQATLMFLWILGLLIGGTLLLPLCLTGIAVWAVRLIFWPIYTTYAAIQVYQGKDFRYAVIADLVERYWSSEGR